MTEKISDLEVYKETGNTIRYYGAVRYILLPVFLTATAALYVQYTRTDNTISPVLLITCGLIISFVFFVFELSLSNNLKKLWKVIEILVRSVVSEYNVDPIPHRRNKRFIIFQRSVLHAPYLLTGIFWIILLITPAEVFPKFLKTTEQDCISEIRNLATSFMDQPSEQWVVDEYQINLDNRIAKAALSIRNDAASRVSFHFNCKEHILIRFERLSDRSITKLPKPPIDTAVLQYCLHNAGKNPGPVDNIFGPSTRQALRQLQISHGLPASGYLDDATRNVLAPCLESQRK